MVALNVQWVYLLKSMDRISSEKMSMGDFDRDLFDLKKGGQSIDRKNNF
jgi:hypothetical protein